MFYLTASSSILILLPNTDWNDFALVYLIFPRALEEGYKGKIYMKAKTEK